MWKSWNLQEGKARSGVLSTASLGPDPAGGRAGSAQPYTVTQGYRGCQTNAYAGTPPTRASLTCMLQAGPTQGKGQDRLSRFPGGAVDARKLGGWGTWLPLFAEHSQGVSLGVSHARGRGVMVCGTLFSSQICLKVAAMPSAFPIPATTHWSAEGLPPARPALWTGTAPPRYRAPDSPQSPSTVPSARERSCTTTSLPRVCTEPLPIQ